MTATLPAQTTIGHVHLKVADLDRALGFYRDVLGVNQALYLDGSVSRLYARDLGRSDWGLPMGPIVGLVEPDN